MSQLKACPMCRPNMFDGDLKRVPEAEFCRVHAGHALRRFFSMAIERDRTGTARPVSQFQEVSK